MKSNKAEIEVKNRRKHLTNISQEKELKESKETVEEENVPPKYGPMPSFPNQRIWTRMMLILGTLMVVYFTSNNDTVIVFARQKESIEYKHRNVPCSQDYISEINTLPVGCRLDKCRMVVRDRILTEKESQRMLDMVHDLYSRAETHILSLDSHLLSPQQSQLLKAVRRKIEEAVGPQEGRLRLAEPSHFTQLSRDTHYPYKEKCKLCHFNALLYLNDFNKDFEGGRSVFLQQDNSTIIIEPKKGRVVGWNGSGGGGMESVSSGVLHIVRLSFSCS